MTMLDTSTEHETRSNTTICIYVHILETHNYMQAYTLYDKRISIYLKYNKCHTLSIVLYLTDAPNVCYLLKDQK